MGSLSYSVVYPSSAHKLCKGIKVYNFFVKRQCILNVTVYKRRSSLLVYDIVFHAKCVSMQGLTLYFIRNINKNYMF
jgi:hypothetical protein